MIVEKVLNNNVVVSIDPKTKKEVILMGSGIAFNKPVTLFLCSEWSFERPPHLVIIKMQIKYIDLLDTVKRTSEVIWMLV